MPGGTLTRSNIPGGNVNAWYNMLPGNVNSNARCKMPGRSVNVMCNMSCQVELLM